jgi:ferritin-like metal-binding protein YciE
MEGLIKEGEEILNEEMEPSVKDAALITAAQKVEHYEMAGYGTARTFAEILGEANDARLLQETLDEEKATDEQLTRIAETHINRQALQLEGYSASR